MGITHLSCERNKMTSDAAPRLNPTTTLVPAPIPRKPLPARWPGDSVPVFLHLTIGLYKGNGFDGGQLPCQLPQLPPARTQQYVQCPWLGSGVGLAVSLFTENYETMKTMPQSSVFRSICLVSRVLTPPAPGSACLPRVLPKSQMALSLVALL